MRHLFSALLALLFVGFSAAAPAEDKKTAPVRVLLSTSEGNITLELDAAKAPVTVANFTQYVKDGFYNGTIFHRVIAEFMIQGGGFTTEMKQKETRAPIALESQNGLGNKRGTIAMARTSNPNSATAQFFINVVDNAQLDFPSFDGNGYAVFGKVVAGMDVVDKIRAVPTGSAAGHQNVPQKAVVIRSAAIVK